MKKEGAERRGYSTSRFANTRNISIPNVWRSDRSIVSSEQLKEYEMLMGEVLKSAEMDLGTHVDH